MNLFLHRRIKKIQTIRNDYMIIKKIECRQIFKSLAVFKKNKNLKDSSNSPCSFFLQGG